MKPKKTQKQLTISKQTIANLTGLTMQDVLGGTAATTKSFREICDTIPGGNTTCCHINASDTCPETGCTVDTVNTLNGQG